MKIGILRRVRRKFRQLMLDQIYSRGLFDSSRAIQKMIDDGGFVELKAGTFRVKRPIDLTGTIQGQGDTVIIKTKTEEKKGASAGE